MHDDLALLYDLVLVLGAAVVVVLAVVKVRLPSIAGFILAGVLIGPHAIGLVRDPHAVHLLAEIGVILLLFGVGLEMPLERLRQLWQPIVVGGALQVVLTGSLAFACARAAGLGASAAIAVAFVVVPSSTAIVLRGLDARGELEAPHGRLMLGILLFQDLCVVPMMLVLPTLASGGGASMWLQLGKSALLLGLVVAAAALIVPRALRVVAASRQRDAFVLSVFLVCAGTAWAASIAGVSLALGAFLAGVVVAGSDYRHQAMTELIPMREVLASVFFVSVGMLLDTRLFVASPLAVFGVFFGLLSGKFLVVALAARLMRLPLRVAVLAGAGLSQIGEFALVLLRSSQGSGVLDQPVVDSVIAAAILSMIVTPLLLDLGPRLAAGAQRLPMLARFFGVPEADDATTLEAGARDHVIIAGYGLAGRMLADALTAQDRSFVVLDLNAASVREATALGRHAYYGDATSADVLLHLGLPRARALVLLINDPAALERAVAAAQRACAAVAIIVRTRYQSEVAKLHTLGADEIVVAEVEAGRAVVQRVMTSIASPKAQEAQA